MSPHELDELAAALAERLTPPRRLTESEAVEAIAAKLAQLPAVDANGYPIQNGDPR